MKPKTEDPRPKPLQYTHTLRVRYSEIDAMGTYYNSRALEWFECGRTELCRATGTPYTEWERRGVMLPLVEAHVEYLGKAGYDDLLKLTTTATMHRRARIRFDVVVEQADSGRPVCRGHTVHAVVDGTGKPIRPPEWVIALVQPSG
jgi:acyl-CoA thioester hydrolase